MSNFILFLLQWRRLAFIGAIVQAVAPAGSASQIEQLSEITSLEQRSYLLSTDGQISGVAPPSERTTAAVAELMNYLRQDGEIAQLESCPSGRSVIALYGPQGTPTHPQWENAIIIADWRHPLESAFSIGRPVRNAYFASSSFVVVSSVEADGGVRTSLHDLRDRQMIYSAPSSLSQLSFNNQDRWAAIKRPSHLIVGHLDEKNMEMITDNRIEIEGRAADYDAVSWSSDGHFALVSSFIRNKRGSGGTYKITALGPEKQIVDTTMDTHLVAVLPDSGSQILATVPKTNGERRYQLFSVSVDEGFVEGPRDFDLDRERWIVLGFDPRGEVLLCRTTRGMQWGASGRVRYKIRSWSPKSGVGRSIDVSGTPVGWLDVN